MPGLPILAGIGGSRGRMLLRLVMATSSFLTGRVQAMQVWGQWQQSSLMRSVQWCGAWSRSKLWSPSVLICEMETALLLSPEAASVIEPGRQWCVGPK